jgi:hypothetical protein
MQYEQKSLFGLDAIPEERKERQAVSYAVIQNTVTGAYFAHETVYGYPVWTRDINKAHHWQSSRQAQAYAQELDEWSKKHAVNMGATRIITHEKSTLPKRTSKLWQQS